MSTAPSRTVGNRSMANLLTVAEPGLGAQADEPSVMSRLAARQAAAPDVDTATLTGTEPSPDSGTEQPLELTESYLPLEGTATTEDGLGVQVVSDEPTTAAAPQTGFVDAGRVGGGRVGSPGGPSDVPRAYVPGGRTGNVTWAGGGGAGPHGNESVGSIQLAFPPIYQSRSNGLFSDSEAWVMPGTGQLIVIRSFVGSNAGDQGNGWWVTPAAAAKLDQHEQMHVTMTKAAYDAYLAPVEAKMGDHKSAYSQSDAIAALKAHIAWEQGVKDFQTWDDLYNFPMKAVDTVDLASGTYVVDSGAGTVAGTAFAHRLRIPSESSPAP